MKSGDFVARLGELVAGGQDREALELSRRHYLEAVSQMDARTLDHVQGLLASALKGVDLEAWQPEERMPTETAAGTASRASRPEFQ